MDKLLKSRLESVRRRQQQLRALLFAAWGLLIAAVGVAIGAIARWLGGFDPPLLQVAAFIAAVPLTAYAAGWLWRRDWRQAALAVDGHYRLKDRAATALEFLARDDRSRVHQLALEDALSHLERVDARQVVPLRAPGVLSYALVSLVAAVMLFVVTSRPAKVSASSAQPLAVVVEQADRAAAELEELEQYAIEEKDPEIEMLVAELKQALEEMKEPGVDLREALAKLSEMQAALEQQQAKQNAAAIDAQLDAIGQALALANPLAEAGKALSAGQFEKAAVELEELDTPMLDRQTEKAVREKLDQVARQMRDSGSGSLSQALDSISEGLGGDSGRFRDGMKRLAGEARRQGKRKKLTDLLQKQCQCLGECKGECEGNSPGTGKGAGGKNWGLGASGNELGERTPEIGGRFETKLTGKQTDEGEIEVETSTSPEARQEAARGYRESYEKYRKLSEAVLDSEPIPLGHRQTIRRYFESIRPTSGEVDAVKELTNPPNASAP